MRTRVKVMLHRLLGGLLFPYGWQLVGTAPFLWGFADLTAARTRAGNWSAAGLTIWCGLTVAVSRPIDFSSDASFSQVFSQKAGECMARPTQKRSCGIAGDGAVICWKLDIVTILCTIFFRHVFGSRVWCCSLAHFGGWPRGQTAGARSRPGDYATFFEMNLLRSTFSKHLTAPSKGMARHIFAAA